MNDFDNGSESRATVLAFHQTQDPIHGDVAPSLGATSIGMGVHASTVRRLTPVECERLQGFPDGWTAHRVQQTGKDTGQVVPQADSHRYRQMGNAVTVDVFAWVLGRLRAYHEGWRP